MAIRRSIYCVHPPRCLCSSRSNLRDETSAFSARNCPEGRGLLAFENRRLVSVPDPKDKRVKGSSHRTARPPPSETLNKSARRTKQRPARGDNNQPRSAPDLNSGRPRIDYGLSRRGAGVRLKHVTLVRLPPASTPGHPIPEMHCPRCVARGSASVQ